MSNDKPTTEHIEYASVQQPQGSDVNNTSGSSNHRSVADVSVRSVTKDDTQTGMRGFIDDTMNDLKKEKSTPRVTAREKTAQTASSTSSKQPKLRERTQKCFPSLFKSCEDRWVFEVICCLFALCNLVAIITIFGRSPAEKFTALALYDIHQLSGIHFHSTYESCNDACCFCRYLTR
jgi:hypothetical protein